ncbi:MAG: FHA domain-containing protein, partial [Armatimonadota bacterium]
DLFISDPNISRCHAKIIKKKCWLIEDQDSKNGTFVNGERVTMRMLNDKDIIQLGNSKLQFLEL